MKMFIKVQDAADYARLSGFTYNHVVNWGDKYAVLDDDELEIWNRDDGVFRPKYGRERGTLTEPVSILCDEDLTSDIEGKRIAATALIRGYQPKDYLTIYQYNGRYGKGIAIVEHSEIGNNYAYITYFVCD